MLEELWACDAAGNLNADLPLTCMQFVSRLRESRMGIQGVGYELTPD